MSAKEDTNTTDWDRPMLRRFKREYAEAVENKEESFRFDGNEYDTEYAKYMICFLDTKL